MQFIKSEQTPSPPPTHTHRLPKRPQSGRLGYSFGSTGLSLVPSWPPCSVVSSVVWLFWHRSWKRFGKYCLLIPSQGLSVPRSKSNKILAKILCFNALSPARLRNSGGDWLHRDHGGRLLVACWLLVIWRRLSCNWGKVLRTIFIFNFVSGFSDIATYKLAQPRRKIPLYFPNFCRILPPDCTSIAEQSPISDFHLTP